MTRFHDGPARGQALDLARSPLYLRVTYDATRSHAGAWDALDRLDDAPEPGEAMHAYRRTGAPVRGMLDYTCAKTRRRRGRPFVMAEYAHCDPQPDDATMRDTGSWRAWCVEQARPKPP